MRTLAAALVVTAGTVMAAVPALAAPGAADPMAAAAMLRDRALAGNTAYGIVATGWRRG
jgi:hypothetical protein